MRQVVYSFMSYCRPVCHISYIMYNVYYIAWRLKFNNADGLFYNDFHSP